MPKFTGTVIFKEYYEVTVEAEDENQARDLMWDIELNNKPYDTDMEIYDIKEEENANA